jgi:hypothetical protein
VPFGSVAVKSVLHLSPTTTGLYSPMMIPPPPVLGKVGVCSRQLSKLSDLSCAAAPVTRAAAIPIAISADRIVALRRM